MRVNCLTLRDKKIENIKTRIAMSGKNRKPRLAIVTSGLDESSKVYVGQKITIGEKKCGINVLTDTPKYHTTEDYIALVKKYNRSRYVDAIIVQLPLPKGVDEYAVLESIMPIKDVDCMTSVNVGRLHLQNPLYYPCTPKGIISILDNEGVDINGKNAVVIGRSNIVGRRIQEMLTQRNATVTLVHTKTSDLDKVTAISNADIVVAATGSKSIVNKELVDNYRMVHGMIGQKTKEQWFIDVGIVRDENNKLHGDLDKELYEDKYIHCTTTPGGTGPMTVISLMENVVDAYLNKDY